MTTTSSPPQIAPMILRSTLTSPYGRKVRMAAHYLGLNDSIEIIAADALDPTDDLREQNPLGKMPCLLVGEDIFFDSRVIMQYFDHLAGGARLVPQCGVVRTKALTLEALADGVTDASLLMTYEHRFRASTHISQRWLDHQRGKVERGLVALTKNLPDPEKTDVVSIALSAALGYLDWRKHLNWREDYPALADWLAEFDAAEPAFGATRSTA